MENSLDIANVCMLAGKIMLESGAETHRVEDTMNRIAAVYGAENAQSYASPTAIHFSVDFADVTHFIRISSRSTDLHKVADVNHISRQIAQESIPLEESMQMLEALEKRRLTFSKWIQVIAAILLSGCFAIMFGGTAKDFLPAAITGGAGFAVMLIIFHIIRIRFVADFFASVLIGVLALGFIRYGYGVELDKIVIGAVMPLVPGLPITIALRDLLAGHLVAGISKGVESILTAVAIGAGVAIVLAIF